MDATDPEVRRALAAGKQVGPYALLGELGRGGMGVVYRAYDTKLGKEVALKVILEAGPSGVERLAREARAAAALRHEAIVSVLHLGEHSGRPYLVMEYVAGESLGALLSRKPLPLPRKLEIARDLARALEHAHGRGVIHRDVKPSNVLVDQEGRARLLDFGLARSSTDQGLTTTGQVLGTPLYMSPEQAGGDPTAHGPASDVYSLGAVLYHMLVGRPPFEAPSAPSLYKKILVDAVPRPRKLVPELPAALDALVVSCLEKDPRLRPGAREVAAKLERALAGAAVASPSRRPLVAALAAGVVLGGGGILAGVVIASGRGASHDPKVGRPAPSSGAPRDHQPAVEGKLPARSWVERGEALRAKGDLEGAISDATRAIELDPACAEAWVLRARSRNGRGERAGTIEDCTRAIELAPALATSWATRASARGDSGDVDGQLADATRAIELAPDLAFAWYVRGNGRSARGDKEGAIADLTRAIELDRSYAAAFTNRASARLDNGDREGAISDLGRAIELDPTRAPPWSTLGQAQVGEGRLDDAIGSFTRAIELDPLLPPPRANRGSARAQKGDHEGAIADLERFLELAPDHPAAGKVRAMIEEERRKLAR